MRQILIQKTPHITKLAGSDIKLLATEDINISQDKVYILRMPLDIKVVAGTAKLDLSFTISEECASAGVMLIGAYWENGAVKAILYSLASDVNIPAGTAVLTATLVEVVSYRQVTTELLNAEVKLQEDSTGAGALEIEPKPPERKKRGRKKKTE